MKKCILGIISVIVAIAALTAALVLYTTALNSGEKVIVKFFDSIDSGDGNGILDAVTGGNSKLKEMYGSMKSVFSGKVASEKALRSFGFKIPGIGYIEDDNEKDVSLKSVTVKGISFVEAEKSSEYSEYAFLGLKISDVNIYDVLLEYILSDSEGKEIKGYAKETITTAEINGNACVMSD